MTMTILIPYSILPVPYSIPIPYPISIPISIPIRFAFLSEATTMVMIPSMADCSCFS